MCLHSIRRSGAFWLTHFRKRAALEANCLYFATLGRYFLPESVVGPLREQYDASNFNRPGQ